MLFQPFRLHRLETGPSNSVTVTRDDALALYEQMHTIRRMETAAGNMYKEKIIRGFCHLYSGQVSLISFFRMSCLDRYSYGSWHRHHSERL
jgi:TPP-dependent pyruvate/acetoin dehydrogenase alpha subunit